MDYLDHFDELQACKDYQPTQFDVKGLNCVEHEICNFKVLLGRNRDSSILENCNFEVALETLGDNSGDVQVYRFGHWACGWLEVLLVSDKGSEELRTKAGEIVCSLADYPILDEDRYHEKCANAANELWENMSPEHRLEYTRENRDTCEFTGFKDLLSCVRKGDYFPGDSFEFAEVF